MKVLGFERFNVLYEGMSYPRLRVYCLNDDNLPRGDTSSPGCFLTGNRVDYFDIKYNIDQYAQALRVGDDIDPIFDKYGNIVKILC